MLRISELMMIDVTGQQWWRHTRYGVLDGYIRGSGAISHYNPWEPESPVSARVTGYLALTQVPDPDRRYPIPAPSTGEVERLIAFSNAYGPLGVLHHRLVEVTLPPEVFRWSGHGWKIRGDGKGDPRVILWTDLGDPFESVVSERLTETWWRFFPSVWEDVHQYYPHVFASSSPVGLAADEITARDWPEPGSRAFRESYREPVPDFMEAALALRDALAWIEDGNQPRRSMRGRRQSVVRLNGLQSVAQQVVLPLPGRGIELRWTSPSLLGALAMQAALDLSAGQEFTVCARDRCGKVFRVARTNQRYCGKDCSNANRQSRYRDSHQKTEAAS